MHINLTISSWEASIVGVVSSQLTNEEEKRGGILEVIDVSDKEACGFTVK